MTSHSDHMTSHSDHMTHTHSSPPPPGTGAAKKGILTFMVGGGSEPFEKAKPLLECMGKNVVLCGTTGSGQAAKICNNMLLGISMIGTSEALQLGIK